MITIKEFEEGIEEALWDVFYSSIRTRCIGDYSSEQLRAWAPDEFKADLWSLRIRSIRPYIATLGPRVVGYADLQSDGYIDHFFVHGEYQSRGVGTALMARILAAGENMDKLSAHVSITARPFFARYGFKVVRAQEAEVRGTKLRNYVMERGQRALTGV